MEIHSAELTISTCDEGHVHITMRSNCDCGVECPGLGTVMNPSDAREVAKQLLKAAATIQPVS
jgi:hypothetical protein